MQPPLSKRLLLLTPENPQPENAGVARAQGLQELGWEIDMLAPLVPGSLREEMLRGITLRRYRDSRLLRGVVAFITLYIEGLMWGIKRRHTVVQSSGLLPAGLAGGWIAWFFSVPHVVELQPGDTAAAAGFASFLRHYVLRRADAVVAATLESAAATQKLQPGVRVKVIAPSQKEAFAELYAKLLQPEGTAFYSYEKKP